jgi:hypothetical protein
MIRCKGTVTRSCQWNDRGRVDISAKFCDIPWKESRHRRKLPYDMVLILPPALQNRR